MAHCKHEGEGVRRVRHLFHCNFNFMSVPAPVQPVQAWGQACAAHQITICVEKAGPQKQSVMLKCAYPRQGLSVQRRAQESVSESSPKTHSQKRSAPQAVSKCELQGRGATQSRGASMWLMEGTPWSG